MNQNHAQLCPSPEWAAYLHRDVLPALADGVELGPRMLELGPGPGASAEWLRHRVEQLVLVDPASLLTRLQTLGFGAITITVDYGFTFRARKPDPDHDGVWEQPS